MCLLTANAPPVANAAAESSFDVWATLRESPRQEGGDEEPKADDVVAEQLQARRAGKIIVMPYQALHSYQQKRATDALLKDLCKVGYRNEVGGSKTANPSNVSYYLDLCVKVKQVFDSVNDVARCDCLAELQDLYEVAFVWEEVNSYRVTNDGAEYVWAPRTIVRPHSPDGSDSAASKSSRAATLNNAGVPYATAGGSVNPISDTTKTPNVRRNGKGALIAIGPYSHYAVMIWIRWFVYPTPVRWF